jgi:Ca-activated chloride channel family protein
MTFNPDDPKWTAYVLGELEDAERAEMDSLLESSEEARAYLEELRVAAGALEHELKVDLAEKKVGFPPEINAGLAASLTEAQRAAIQAAAGAANTANNIRWFKQPQAHQALLGGLAVAAMILIAIAIPSIWKSRKTDSTANVSVLSAGALKVEESISASPVIPAQGGSKPAVSSDDKAMKNSERSEASRDSAEQDSKLVYGTAVIPQPGKAEAVRGVPQGTSNGSPNANAARERLGNDGRLQNGVYSTTLVNPDLVGEAVRVTPPPSPALGTDPQSSLNTNVIAGDALKDLPANQDDLLAYLSELSKLRGGDGNVTITVDGFTAGNLPPQAQIAPIGQQGRQGQQGQQGQVQGQGQQAGQGQGQSALAAPRGGGGGRGGARGGAAAAPPPPPPPAVSAPVRIIPDNPTTLDGINIYDRRAAPNTASYAPIIDNPFRRASQEELSTFSSDVDTASYANLRRFINQNQLPPAAAVRIEEMVNYFNYDYAQPSTKDPIGASMEIASAPWNPTHRLVRIGIKARDIDSRRRPSSNLVFLIDVSGSMQPPERLPLIKSGLKMLAGSLTENDHVSIVVYAGASGVVLPYTSGNRRDIINAALDRLEAGGSTNGGAGIQLAYQIATSNFIPGGVNRVILATDGDFNVGVTNQNELTRLIQERAKSGVFLSVLGVGTDNLKDSTMERLADTGNGNYAYLDSLNEAYKVLVEQMSGTLVTVAKDVKLQVDFNPAVVEAYRLIGYENRLLANADFNNDRKDAGDMGAGHTVTALYEIVPRGGSVPGPDVDPLKYQTPAQAPAPAPQVRNGSSETLTLKIRYKDPDGTESKLLSLPLTDREGTFSKASADFRFAASVAEFGMIMRDSPYRGKASIGEVIENAQASKGSDRNGYRQEFIGLVQKTRRLRGLD